MNKLGKMSVALSEFTCVALAGQVCVCRSDLKIALGGSK